MKQKDIAIILIIVAVAGFISFFVSGFLFGDKAKDTEVEKVDTISTTFAQPNKKYFNEKSINPTQLIEVIDNNNIDPFKN